MHHFSYIQLIAIGDRAGCRLGGETVTQQRARRHYCAGPPQAKFLNFRGDSTCALSCV